MEIKVEPEKNLIEEYMLLTEINEFDYHYYFATFGPIGPIKNMISEVTIEGNFSGIEKIQNFLNKPILRFITPLPFGVVLIDEEINFTIYYKKSVRDKSRFSYFSMYGNLSMDNITMEPILDMDNATLVHNQIHKVRVEGFQGMFILSHAKLYQRPIIRLRDQIFVRGRFFIPSHFIFTGMCKNITEMDLPI